MTLLRTERDPSETTIALRSHLPAAVFGIAQAQRATPPRLLLATGRSACRPIFAEQVTR